MALYCALLQFPQSKQILLFSPVYLLLLLFISAIYALLLPDGRAVSDAGLQNIIVDAFKSSHFLLLYVVESLLEYLSFF